MSASVLVLLSGGLDSAVCAAHYRSHGYMTRALFVDYGHPAAASERVAASAVADWLAVPITTVEVGGVTSLPGKVVGRNAMLLAVALLANTTFPSLVALGIHAGTEYEDCSPDFLLKMQSVYDLYADGRVRIDAPLISFAKREVVSLAEAHRIPIDLTYSCEKGVQPPCGSCQSCYDRA